MREMASIAASGSVFTKSPFQYHCKPFRDRARRTALQHRKRHGLRPVDDRFRQRRADRVDGFLGVSRSGPLWQTSERAHLLVPMLLRERIAGRNGLQPEQHAEIVRRARLEIAVPAHHRGGVGEIEDNGPP